MLCDSYQRKFKGISLRKTAEIYLEFLTAKYILSLARILNNE
jgi:hypothetical protein